MYKHLAVAQNNINLCNTAAQININFTYHDIYDCLLLVLGGNSITKLKMQLNL